MISALLLFVILVGAAAFVASFFDDGDGPGGGEADSTRLVWGVA